MSRVGFCSMLLTLTLLGAPASASSPASGSSPAAATGVTVREEGGVYHVAAMFSTPQPMTVAHAVLTDYEQIPRFMPDVRASRIIERGDGRLVVEQEAVARILFFSKRVRLLLDVESAPATIRFRDRSGESFRRYEGVWTLTERDGHATVSYALTAQPAFDVPEFILTRLLSRDASRMIERLRAEMAARGSVEYRVP